MVSQLRRAWAWLREHVVDAIWDHWVSLLLAVLLGGAASAAITTQVVAPAPSCLTADELRSMILLPTRSCDENYGCATCYCCPECPAPGR